MHTQSFRHFDTIAVFFVATLLVSNIAATKIVDFGALAFDAGTLLFPFAYIFGDVLTEVYGYKKTRKVIWLGFLSAAMMSLLFIIIGKLPPAADWPFQEDFMNILGLTPRIVFASLIAYTIGEFSNSYIMAKMKVRMKGKKLWMRTIGSTIVGQGLDTALFVLIAFWGVFPPALVWTMVVSNYIFKVGVEILFTPATYAIVNKLKKDEGVDVYDKKTNFSPFAS